MARNSGTFHTRGTLGAISRTANNSIMMDENILKRLKKVKKLKKNGNVIDYSQYVFNEIVKEIGLPSDLHFPFGDFDYPGFRL